MSTLQPAGFALPDAFRDKLFETIKNRVAAKIPGPSFEWDNIAGGHNAVRYRLRACADYSDEFTHSVATSGDAPPQLERYRQERQLFGFFVSGIAALDSFSFFLYFAAAHIRPVGFPTQNQRQVRAIKVKSTALAFAMEFPGETITTVLGNLTKDPKFEEWNRFRNVLAHRAAPGRNIYASVGTSRPDADADWKIDPTGAIKIDANLTPPRLEWVVTTLAKLVETADDFTQRYF